MTYYRLAMHHQQTDTWAWKSTVVTSLQALFQLLRIYRVLPQDRLHVFSSPYKEELTETMLNCEKNSLAVYSTTAAEFSHARKLQMREVTPSAYNRGTVETTVRRSTDVAPAFSWRANSMAPSSFTASGVNVLEKRRLESEMGPGGDHDLSYTFLLPASIPQVLAWMRLLARVQSGELQP